MFPCLYPRLHHLFSMTNKLHLFRCLSFSAPLTHSCLLKSYLNFTYLAEPRTNTSVLFYNSITHHKTSLGEHQCAQAVKKQLWSHSSAFCTASRNTDPQSLWFLNCDGVRAFLGYCAPYPCLKQLLHTVNKKYKNLIN